MRAMDERAVIEAQLGRAARGKVEVAARCEHGLPLVIRTGARLEDGSPFPTLYWLTCPLAVRLAGALEASGIMKDLTAMVETNEAVAAEYRAAHERYVAARDGDGAPASAESAGGMPRRVKCLHALYAHEIADANPIGALVREHIEPMSCPGPCVEEAEGNVRRVPGR